MGHTSATMTALYTGEIPAESVVAEFSRKLGDKTAVLENMEDEAAAQLNDFNGAAYENRTHA